MLRAARRFFSLGESLSADIAASATDSLHRFRPQRSRILPVHNGARVALFAIISAATLFVAQHIDVRDPYSPGRVIGAAHYALDRTTMEVREVIARAEPKFLQPGQSSAFEIEQQMSMRELLDRWTPFVQEASKRFQVPAAWIRAVMQAESGGRTMLGENQQIVSNAGAVGLMQLMPSTYGQMRKQFGLGSNPFNPRDNILAGAAYLHWLYTKYGFPRMFAAYNAGPNKLQNCMAKGTTLPAETRTYVTRIATTLGTPLTAPLIPIRAVARVKTVKFTRPNGALVSIDPHSVRNIRKPLPREYAKNVHAVITVGKARQAVRETVATVKAALHRMA